MLSYAAREPRKQENHEKRRSFRELPPATAHKTKYTAATFPFNPSPLSEAEGEDAAVLPLTWMPLCARGCRTRHPRDFSRHVSLCGTSPLNQCASFSGRHFEFPGTSFPRCFKPVLLAKRRWHTPRRDGKMTRPKPRDRRCVAPSREAAKECSPRRKPWVA